MTEKVESAICLESILTEIGFLSNNSGLQFNFGNCELQVVEGINRYFQEGFHFIGYYISERQAGMLEFTLPLYVETYEQGLALIAYNLRKADLKIRPKWLSQGIALHEHLPWEKE